MSTSSKRTPRTAAVLTAFGVWTTTAVSGCHGGIAGSGVTDDSGTAMDTACPTGDCGCTCAGPVPSACRCAPNDASGASCTLPASAYDQSCTRDSDCIAVFLGNVCNDICHGVCPNAAINIHDDVRYTADLAAVPQPQPSNMNSACSCAAGSAVCRAGACRAMITVGSPTDAGETGASGCSSNTDCPIGDFCDLLVHGGAPGVCCPALGCAPNCPNGVRKDSNGCETCQCADGPDGASIPLDGGSTGAEGGDTASTCTTSADCAAGEVCGFPEADGCSAKGSCFPAPGVVCLAYSPGCACDGTEITVVCTGLPSGYVSKPLRHTGVCSSDAGAGD